MSNDTVCGEWIDNKLTAVAPELLPMFLKRTGDVEKWLKLRAIDGNRPNAQLLKKMLGLEKSDDIGTVLRINAAAINDSFWVKPPDSPLKHADVRFSNDFFASVALRGEKGHYGKVIMYNVTTTPELTNTGRCEKCWRRLDGGWYMYKKAFHSAAFSEIFVCALGRMLGFNMAEYSRGHQFVICKDFTDNGALNFEPAYSFMGDNADYIANVEYFKSLKIGRKVKAGIIRDYVQMLFLDTICANPERTTFDYGFLTKATTGKITGLAPDFDNNEALLSKGYPEDISRSNDILVKRFNELLAYDPDLRQYIPEIPEDLPDKVMVYISMGMRTKTVTDFIMNGYKQIEKNI